MPSEWLHSKRASIWTRAVGEVWPSRIGCLLLPWATASSGSLLSESDSSFPRHGHTPGWHCGASCAHRLMFSGLDWLLGQMLTLSCACLRSPDGRSFHHTSGRLWDIRTFFLGEHDSPWSWSLECSTSVCHFKWQITSTLCLPTLTYRVPRLLLSTCPAPQSKMFCPDYSMGRSAQSHCFTLTYRPQTEGSCWGGTSLQHFTL